MNEPTTRPGRRNPFPGPVALGREYPVFGRDSEIAKLHGLLVAERVVILYGISGAGKSSVLAGYGGLRDRFMNDGHFSVLGPIEFRLPEEKAPGDDAFYERFLVGLLSREEPEEHRIEDLDTLKRIGLETFFARRRRYLEQPYQLLIIDQFEEVFTKLVHDELGKRTFFQALGNLVERRSDLWLLIAMREEYVAEIDHYRRLMPGRFRAGFRLELLANQAAERAILATAANAEPSIRLCTDNVSELVENLSRVSLVAPDGTHGYEPGQYVEPLFLQLACRDAWPMVVDTYERDANDGADCYALQRNLEDASLDQVLRRFYDAEIEKVTAERPQEEYRIRAFFEDGLISQKGQRSLISGVQSEENWGLSHNLLSELLSTHLVRPQIRHQLTYYELAHDRLVEPIGDSNRRWMEDQPAWRKAARKWRLGGGETGSYPVSLRQLWKSRRAQRSGSTVLTPFEAQFIREKLHEKGRRFLYPLVWLTTVGILTYFVTWGVNREAQKRIDAAQVLAEVLEEEKTQALAKADALAEERTRALENAEELERDKRRTLKDVKEKNARLKDLELSLGEKKAKVDEQKARARIRGLLAASHERKLGDHRDQAAVLQVSHAYRALWQTLPESEWPEFQSLLFSAFNNAFLPDSHALGFSRTAPRVEHVSGLIAFYGGPKPMTAYLDRSNRLVIEHFGSEKTAQGSPAVIELGPELLPLGLLRFTPDGRRLLLVSPQIVAWLDTEAAIEGSASSPVETLGEVPGPMGKAMVSNGVSASAFSSDGSELLFAVSNRVMRLCRSKRRALKPCGGLSLEDKRFKTISAIAVLGRSSRKPVVAYGTPEGFVGIKVWMKRRWLTTSDPPKKKYTSPLRESFKVMALAFKPGSQGGTDDYASVVVVHEDTQNFLLTRTVADPQGATRTKGYVKIPIKQDSGSYAHGSVTEYDTSHYNAAELTADGKTLYAIFEDGIERWDLDSSKRKPRIDEDLLVPVATYETGARNLKHLTAGSDYLLAEGHFYRWSWEVGGSEHVSKMVSQVLRPGTHRKYFYPYRILFAPDGFFLTASSRWAAQRLALREGGGLVREHITPCANSLSARSLSLSPDGRYFAAGLSKGYVSVGALDGPWDKVWCNGEVHGDGLWATAFSNRGTWLASGDWQGRIALWSLRNGLPPEHLDTLDLMPDPADCRLVSGKCAAIRSLAFHPGSDLLIAGMQSGTIAAFSISKEGKLRRVAMEKGEPIGAIYSLDFSSDGRLLAAAGGSGPIGIWDTQTFGEETSIKPLIPLKGHSGGTRSIEFRPGSRAGLHELVSGGADGLVRVWNPDAPAAVPAVLKSYGSDVLTVSWDRDGMHIVSGHKDGRVLIWSWSLERFGRLACDLVWRELSEKEWTDWIQPFTDLPKGFVCGGDLGRRVTNEVER